MIKNIKSGLTPILDIQNLNCRLRSEKRLKSLGKLSNFVACQQFEAGVCLLCIQDIATSCKHHSLTSIHDATGNQLSFTSVKYKTFFTHDPQFYCPKCWLTGDFNEIAARDSDHKAIVTKASNLGQKQCRQARKHHIMFGKQIIGKF